MVVAIDPIAPASGGLQFTLDRHHERQPGLVGEARDVDPASVADAPRWDAEAPAGSVIVFHSLTPHGSGPNRSGGPRRLLYLSFVSDELKELRDVYYRARWSTP